MYLHVICYDFIELMWKRHEKTPAVRTAMSLLLFANDCGAKAPDRYKDREKGFTKVTRTMNRQGDWSEMAYIELL